MKELNKEWKDELLLNITPLNRKSQMQEEWNKEIQECIEKGDVEVLRKMENLVRFVIETRKKVMTEVQKLRIQQNSLESVLGIKRKATEKQDSGYKTWYKPERKRSEKDIKRADFKSGLTKRNMNRK